jgi:integrase
MRKANYQKMQTRVSRVEAAGATGIERVAKFIKFLVDLKSCDLLPGEHYAFSLLLLDGVPLDSIEIAVRQQPKVCPNGINICWQYPSGRVDRFLLSPVSIRLHANLDHLEIAIDAKKLIATYQKIYQRHSLKSDLSEWLAFHCPGLIFDYLTGLLSMSSIPDSAYIRLHRQEAIFNDDLNNDQSLFVRSMTHIFEAEKVEASEVFVDGIVTACGRKSGKSDAQAKKVMLQKCEQLAKLLDDYGPISALILSWATHLIMHGTRAKENLSQATIANYVGTISKPLFKEIKSIKISELAEQNYLEIYTRILDAVSESQKGIAASALSTFHTFLEDWFGVTPVYRGQFCKDVEVAPKSNVVWPHEIVLIKRWLDTATADSRLVESWRLAILLANHQRFRVGEIFNLRLRDITIYSDYALIHIASGKTYAAKRTLKVEDRSVLDALSALVERRKLEMASPSDFLFGDPARPNKLYRHGHFYWGLNQLLKQATGDQKISFHSLSDTVISNQLIQPLSGDDSGFKNNLNQLATDFAHQSIITSCSAYMHLHHLSIRMCMDRALKTVAITSAIAAQWSNKSADTLRKQVSLKRLDSNQYFWMQILDMHAKQDDFECCGAEIATQEPMIPEFLQRQSPTSFDKVLLIIKDLAEGLLIHSVCSRHSVDHVFVERILNALESLLVEKGFVAAIYSKSLARLQANAQRLKSFGIDFDRAYHPKLNALMQFFKTKKLPFNQDTQQGVLAWLQLCDKKHYQAVDTNIETFQLIKLLKSASIKETNIALFISEKHSTGEYVAMLKKLFLMSYSIPPAIFPVKERRDRPDMYFSICDKVVRVGVEPHGAANCMSGFRAIMLSLAVMLRMESDHA